ncbi:cytochrome c [Falsiroseomonas oryziterrae]|uniref:cytochrome c n=1 Tax=Falsiroseomonas oryziterrae TaxID=2911368 RepID=UPI001F44AA21|nr:cytochrome c [Roseomonas sp. NPKOSM-4]
MKAWILAAVAAAGVGATGMAMAQGNLAAERRAGFREMGSHMEAIAAIVQSRGDQRQIAARVDQMVPFYQSLPNRVPAASLTPPVPQGTQDGQTRALAAIDANRADFGARNQNMLTALAALKSAAEAGNVTPDLLRSTGGACSACHQSYRAR